MRVQIVQDSRGNSTGVFIPMDKWNLIKSTYPHIECVDEDATASMKAAASELYNDYRHDKDLTVFKELDFEQFYETR